MSKNLEATGLSTAGAALKNTFDLLNINRMQSGIDTYGQVWCFVLTGGRQDGPVGKGSHQ